MYLAINEDLQIIKMSDEILKDDSLEIIELKGIDLETFRTKGHKIEIVDNVKTCILSNASEVNTLLTEAEIDEKVVEKIREKYDINKESKMLRLGILDKTNAEFVEYNEYVEQCRAWG